MKKFLSFILATAIILSLIPAAFAAGEEAAAEPQNLTLVYDISGFVDVLNPATATGGTSVLTAENTDGYWRFVSCENGTFYDARSSASGAYNGFQFSSSANGTKSISFDVYVPVAGVYKMTGKHATYANGGVVEVYVNGSETAAGSYDCYAESGSDTNNSGELEIPNISLNAGWNNIKFIAVTSNKGGTVRTFTLTLGDGSGYALMGVREKKLTVGETYTVETFNSSEESYTIKSPTKDKVNNKITEGLSYVSSNAAAAEVSDAGVITAKAYGTATVTVSDATGHSYDIAVTVDNPEVTRIKYDVTGVFVDNKITLADIEEGALTEDITNGFFRFNSWTDNSSVNIYSTRGTRENNGAEIKEGKSFSLDVYVPVAGTYIMEGTYAKWAKGGEVEVYVNDAATAAGSYDCAGSAENPYNRNGKLNIPNISLNAGWNKITFSTEKSAKQGAVRNFELVLGTSSGNALMPYLNGSTTLEIGKNETATLKGFLSADASPATVEYSVEGDCVSVSADGIITASKAGTATVTMTETANAAPVANPYEVEIKVVKQDEALTNAFDDAAEGSVPEDYIAPTVDAIDAEGLLADPVPVAGGAYKLEAAAEAGERGAFLYWKKAMGLNEKIVSFENVFNYVPESTGRNILVAVYEGDVTSTSPKCYNANGQYLKGAQPIAANLPSMAGYGKAVAWAQYKNTNVFVAQYELEEPAKNITVTVDSEEGTYAYGETVTCTATEENFKCWKKDGKIVSVKSTYTFKAWEDCTVEAVYEDDVYYTGSTMKIIIDSFTAGDEIGVMAEFIGFVNNVVEKGIMVDGNRIAMTTVGNQFSVIADEAGEYVGYAIIRVGDELKLITEGSFTK